MGVLLIFSRRIITACFILSFIALSMASESKAAAPEPSGASLSGFVKDKKNGETLIGATVMFKGTTKGAYTNKAGFYTITDIVPGEYTVSVSMLGYKAYEEKVTISANKSLRKTYTLEMMDEMTDEIVVSAESEIEKREITVSKVNIPVKQLKEIRIGGESDVFRSLQMLPGVLASSQISSGLYIRGGSPDQNLVLLDGSTVYNPSHLFGFISTFNADAIKDVDLIKGGYPSEFSGRLSAVLNVTQKDGNREEIEGRLSTGLISSKLSVQGPLSEHGSWFLSGRRTYFDLVKGFLGDDPENPIPDFGFYDLNGKVSLDLGDNDRLYLSGFLSKDNFEMESSGMDMQMYMGNKSGSLKWQRIWGDNIFTFVNLTASHYNTGYDQDVSGYKVKVENTITDYTLKGNLDWFATEDLTVKTGFEFTNYKFNFDQDFTGDGSGDEISSGSEGGVMKLAPRDWVYGIFAQMNYSFNPVLSGQGGFRVSYWDDSEELVHDPRFSLKYVMTEDMILKASWGVYHQYLRLASMENFSIFDTWLPNDGTVDASKAIHYILSLETTPAESYALNFDLYYKDLRHISELNMLSLEGDKVSDIFYDGDGKAYGAEVFFQKKIGNFVGWIGYGFGFVESQFDSINGGRTFRPKYDRRHDLKVVAQYKLNETWDFGMSFTFQSGQSYTGATSRFQTFLPDQNYGSGLVVPSDKYGLRLPPSHQLNLSAGYSFKFFGLPSRLILDIYNVYSRRDILFRYFDTEGTETEVKDVLLLPILPTFSWDIEF